MDEHFQKLLLPDPNSPRGHSVRHTQFLSDIQTQFNFQKLTFQEKKATGVLP